MDTDAHSQPEAPIDQIQVGDEFAERELRVTPEQNQQFVYAADDFDPRYLTGSNSQPPIVHPALLLSFFALSSGSTVVPGDQRPLTYFAPPGVVALHSQDEVEFLNPAYVGSTLRGHQTFVEVHESRGRLWQTYEALLVDDRGREIMRRRATRAVVGAASG